MINSNRGFTLIEILIASAISLIVLASIMLAIDSAQKSSTGIERKITAQQDARLALEIMEMEIRMASYNPTFASGIWQTTTCSGAAANQNYRGIQEATANSLTVEMDINDAAGTGSGDGILGDPNETIRYNYVITSGNQYITRETNCGGGQPFLGDSIVGGRPRTVRVINNDLNNLPIFRYYDGTGTEILPANLPASIPNIRSVEITLAVETEEIDPGTGQGRRMVYSTLVIARNHAI